MGISARIKDRYLARLDELIQLGEHMPMRQHSQVTSSNYITGETRYRHYSLASWPEFVEWRTSCVAVLDQVVPTSSLLRKTVDIFHTLGNEPSKVEFGVGFLRSVKAEVQNGSLNSQKRPRMQVRPAVPKRTEKALFKEVNSRCPICGQDDISVLVIHHIVSFEEVPAHNPDDMLVLCANCHAKAHSGELNREQLYAAKKSARKVVPLHGGSSSARTVVGSGGIVAGGDIIAGRDIKVHIPRGTSKPRQPIIPDTVATDANKVGYLKHLVKRYIEFKEYEVGKGNMRYPIIYQSYEREIGYSITNTPLNRFSDAITYLGRRIANTKLGRIRKSQSQKLYSSFEEFVRGEDL